MQEDSTELGAEGVVDFGDMAMLSAKDFYFRMYSKFKEEPYGGVCPVDVQQSQPEPPIRI